MVADELVVTEYGIPGSAARIRGSLRFSGGMRWCVEAPFGCWLIGVGDWTVPSIIEALKSRYGCVYLDRNGQWSVLGARYHSSPELAHKAWERLPQKMRLLCSDSHKAIASNPGIDMIVYMQGVEEMLNGMPREAGCLVRPWQLKEMLMGAQMELAKRYGEKGGH